MRCSPPDFSAFPELVAFRKAKRRRRSRSDPARGDSWRAVLCRYRLAPQFFQVDHHGAPALTQRLRQVGMVGLHLAGGTLRRETEVNVELEGSVREQRESARYFPPGREPARGVFQPQDSFAHLRPLCFCLVETNDLFAERVFRPLLLPHGLVEKEELRNQGVLRLPAESGNLGLDSSALASWHCARSRMSRGSRLRLLFGGCRCSI